MLYVGYLFENNNCTGIRGRNNYCNFQTHFPSDIAPSDVLQFAKPHLISEDTMLSKMARPNHRHVPSIFPTTYWETLK